MRVVLDTNILVSAFMVQWGYSGTIYNAWHQRFFTLLTCAGQLEEMEVAMRKPALAALIKPYEAGSLINGLRDLTETLGTLPNVSRASDPNDNFLLALSQAGNVDYLVTGDKSGLLLLNEHCGTRILSARAFASRLPLL